MRNYQFFFFRYGFNSTTVHSLLTLLLDVVYDDVTDDVLPTSHIYGMMKSHSAFLPTMLSLANEVEIKGMNYFHIDLDEIFDLGSKGDRFSRFFGPLSLNSGIS